MAIIEYYTNRFCQGLLLEEGQRLYVVAQQAMSLKALPTTVPMSYDEQLVSTVEVHPEHMVSLALLDIQVTGPTAAGNRTQLIQAMKDWIQTFMPTGTVDVQAAAKAMLGLMQWRGAEQLLVNKDQMSYPHWIQNVMGALGFKGIEMLPPEVQMMVMGVPMGQPGTPMGPGGPQGGPMGAPGGQNGMQGRMMGGASGGPQGAQGMQPFAQTTAAGGAMMGGGSVAGINFNPGQ